MTKSVMIYYIIVMVTGEYVDSYLMYKDKCQHSQKIYLVQHIIVTVTLTVGTFVTENEIQKIIIYPTRLIFSS